MTSFARHASSVAVAAALFMSGGSLPAEAAVTQSFTAAGLNVSAWLPDRPAPAAPVIVFSHGFRGCGIQSAGLMQALADRGYAVFAPDHADSLCLTLFTSGLALGEMPFFTPERWSNRTYADRGSDIRELLDTLSRDPRYRDYDWDNVGLAGHSLGGYTALGLAGGWTEWKDPRVKAVLALSAYSPPYIVKGTMANIDVPVMFQGGTRDLIEPRVNNAAYEAIRSAKYYIELQGADHFAWTLLQNRHNAPINAYSIAFFDTHLKGLPFPAELRRRTPELSALRIDPASPR